MLVKHYDYLFHLYPIDINTGTELPVDPLAEAVAAIAIPLANAIGQLNAFTTVLDCMVSKDTLGTVELKVTLAAVTANIWTQAGNVFGLYTW